MRIGIGYDSHRLAAGRTFVLGGVEIPHEKGLLGHSDGDALCHAITDAVLGALGEGDIGRHFPDTDIQWKGASSVMILKTVIDMALSRGYSVAWIDTVIIAERPRIAPHTEKMKEVLALAGIPAGHISIKAKTNEGMGWVGRGEGIAAQAVCLLTRTSEEHRFTREKEALNS